LGSKYETQVVETVKSLLFTLSLLLISSTAYSQEDTPAPSGSSVQLSVPLLQGTPAPFSGLLITEDHATQCIEDAAAVSRLRVETSVRTRQLSLSTHLYEAFIEDQRERIRGLLQTSWWDRNGNVFMLGVGIVLGVVGSALLVGLANNN